jgi:NarL family two-component system response regulator LiaR
MISLDSDNVSERERGTMTGSNLIRVLIVDDHAVVRSGLKAFLLAFDDIELVGEAAGGEEAVHLCAQLQPDVVLMDMVMPGMNGADATYAIREQCPQVQVIVLTSFPDEDLVERALAAGAISYLLKNVLGDELAEAIRAAYAGHRTLALEVAQALAYVAIHPSGLGRNLTEREQEVLPLLVEGLNNSQIAGRLKVSRSTIRFHVSNILAKLGATSRTQAVALAVRHKLVT